MAVRIRHGVTRRRLLASAASATAFSAIGSIAKPYLSRAADRPLVSARDLVRRCVRRFGRDLGRVPIVRPECRSRSPPRTASRLSGTARSPMRCPRAILPPRSARGLAGGQDIFYRVQFQDLSSPTLVGEPLVGRFRTAPADRRSISFVWSGDTAGQGWGIDEARGGMRTYAVMQRNRPDFLIHNGDTIYADGPIVAEQKLPNGEMWKNIVTQEKSKPAETLAEFRGNYKYNLLDKNVRAFNAEVPVFSQWDDHEVTNNWWPGEPLTRAEHQRKKYVEKNALLLAARANRAFREYMPMRELIVEPGRVYRRISYGPLLDIWMLDMRSYRGPNGEDKQETYGPDAYFLGPAQVAWLKRELVNSRATWKVIAADMPVGLIVPYDADRKWGFEGVAQGDGPALGRELEIADLLPSSSTQAFRINLMAHGRRALHRRPLLRSQQGGVPGLRAVLGIRLRPDPRRHLRAQYSRQHVWSAAALHQGAEQGAGPEFAAERRHAVLRPCRDRRRLRGDDRDPQGCRRSGVVVDQA